MWFPFFGLADFFFFTTSKIPTIQIFWSWNHQPLFQMILNLYYSTYGYLWRTVWYNLDPACHDSSQSNHEESFSLDVVCLINPWNFILWWLDMFHRLRTFSICWKMQRDVFTRLVCFKSWCIKNFSLLHLIQPQVWKGRESTDAKWGHERQDTWRIVGWTCSNPWDDVVLVIVVAYIYIYIYNII